MYRLMIWSHYVNGQNFYRVANRQLINPITYYGQYSLSIDKSTFKLIKPSNKMLLKLIKHFNKLDISTNVDYYRNIKYHKVFSIKVDSLIEINCWGHIFVYTSDINLLNDICEQLNNWFNQLWAHSKWLMIN